MSEEESAIFELEPGQFEKARPLFDAIGFNLAPIAILEGALPGRVYVDDLDAPQTAVTWSKHRIFLSGFTNSSGFYAGLNWLFENRFTPQAVTDGKNQFLVYYSPDKWAERVDAVFPEKAFIADRRLYFTFEKLKHSWKAMLPPGCELMRVDEELLRRTQLKNLDFLIEEMRSERHSIRAFLNNSFGFCLLCGDEIVSWCLSENNCRKRCELGIETMEGYRRRSYGTMTASACVEHALAHEIAEIGWHCWESNQPSIALAKTVGFRMQLVYPVFFFQLRRLVELPGTCVPLPLPTR